jgi:hypothetical protein
MEQMFYTPMHKTMHMQCYHYETKYITQKDANGNTTHRTEQVRVNTHSATERYYYISWRDISGKFDLDVSGGMGQQEKPFVKLHLRLLMNLAEDGTEADFHYQKRSFIFRNYLDSFYDFNETLDMHGYNEYEYTLVRVTDFNPPCFGAPWFILFTLLTVAEFYKLHLDKYSIVQDFNIVKVVSSRQDLNSPQYVQQYAAMMPCIVFMGNVREYNGPMILAQGDLTPPPPPPPNMPPGDELPQNMQINMSAGGQGMTMNVSHEGQPGMSMNINMTANSPVLH